MLINFSVRNFGSIKEKQTLSFEATKSNELEDYYVIDSDNDIRLLKLALIYGANASGKTTILKALNYLRELVLKPEEKKTNTLDFNPFQFDKDFLNGSTTFWIDFIQNKVRYSYFLEYCEKAILSEELNYYSPNKASVFKRTTDIDKQFTEITFGSKIKKDKTFEKNLEANTLWNNTVLGGFLKTNIELSQLKEVTDWFSEYLRPLVETKTELDGYITSQIEKSKLKKENLVYILKKADFNISDILINEEKTDVNEKMLKVFEALELPEDMIEKIRSNPLMKLELEHTIDGKRYSLPFNLESQGTQRYYGFAGLLSLLINSSIAFPIDELEDSLHPDLYVHFLLSFLVNSKKSQIIATTHNREILNNKDLFRNDVIWFTDKNESCSTELYSLSDFDSSTVRDTTNIFNAYKAGKLGGTPNLGDYYMNFEYEN
jgi:AAA15 family ATPase/GTPase